MRKMIALVYASILTGCASNPPLLMQAKMEGEVCTVRFNGLVLSSDALDDPRLLSLAKAHGGRMVLDADANTPYRCIGGTMFNLQRSGFRVVSVRVNGVELPRQ